MADEVAQAVSLEDKAGSIFFPDQPAEEPKEEAPPAETEELEAEGSPEDTDVAGEEPEGESEEEPGWAELVYDDIPVFVDPKHHDRIRDSLMRTKDYTVKTQELSRQREALEAQQRQIEAANEAQRFAESVREEQQQLAIINSQLSQFDEVNWQELSDSDMLRTKHQFEVLERKGKGLQETIQRKQQEWSEAQQAAQREYLSNAKAYLDKEIGEWNDDKANAVAQYALSQGYTDAQIANPYISPIDIKVLWKAKLYDELKASSGKAQEEARKAPAVPKPGPRVGMPKERAQYLNFRKALKKAKDPKTGDARQVERVLQGRIEDKFG